MQDLTEAVIDLRPDDREEPQSEAPKYKLKGLTQRMMRMEPGSGILIPSQEGWTSAVYQNLRLRIGTIAHRCYKKTGDRFVLRTTNRGFEVWRLPTTEGEPHETD